MQPLSASEIARIVDGTLSGPVPDRLVTRVSVDSRACDATSLFVALAGEHADGHAFVHAAFANGAVAAIVSNQHAQAREGCRIAVPSPLDALQALACWWRDRLADTQVIAVTGSNGKTIVKDAIARILNSRHNTAASPGSFNSQIGVPLALLRVPHDARFAVMEAGVSKPGEMERLEAMLKPDFGVLTNVGLAHIASFGTQDAIAREKTRLFANVKWVLAPADCPAAEPYLPGGVHRFGATDDRLPRIEYRQPIDSGTLISVRFPDQQVRKITVATPSLEIIADVDASICAAWLLGMGADDIAESLAGYEPGLTRMEFWRSSQSGVTVINDSCSSDPISVQAALRSLGDAQRRIFVFSGMDDLGGLEGEEYAQIGRMAATSGIDVLVLVGRQRVGFEALEASFRQDQPTAEVVRCGTEPEARAALLTRVRWGDKVLFKGPPQTGIDRVARGIIDAMAPNRLIVDLQAIAENVSRIRRITGGARILAMVKALAYGSDAPRLSLELQRIGVDCLGVSTADEGATLRRAGVELPILVMLCSVDEVDKAVHHRLTPVVYAEDLVAPLARAARGGVLDVHLEIDTGMARLGVPPDDAPTVARAIQETGTLRLVGVMTHFACADDPERDDFTRQQIRDFEDAVTAIGIPGLIRHAAATSGALRFPEGRFEMVRIGLGLYGLYPSPAVADEVELDLAVSLVSRIAEVHVLRQGQTVGYGSTFRAPRDGFRIGLIPLGYHDGMPWSASNRGVVLVHGREARIVGRISMDSMTVDISEIPDARAGSDVLLYGSHDGHVLRPERVAEQAGTIPYELLSRLGPRVERIFIGR